MIIQYSNKTVPTGQSVTYPIAFTTLNYALRGFMFIQGYSGNYLSCSITGFTTTVDGHTQSTSGGWIAIGY